jgi:hypothetical protein
METGTFVILEGDENFDDFPECLEALLVIRADGTVLKDRMGVLALPANANVELPPPGRPASPETAPGG